MRGRLLNCKKRREGGAIITRAYEIARVCVCVDVCGRCVGGHCALLQKGDSSAIVMLPHDDDMILQCSSDSLVSFAAKVAYLANAIIGFAGRRENLNFCVAIRVSLGRIFV